MSKKHQTSYVNAPLSFFRQLPNPKYDKHFLVDSTCGNHMGMSIAYDDKIERTYFH